MIYILVLIDILSFASAQLLLKKGVAVFGTPEISFGNAMNLIIMFFKNIYLPAGLALLGIGFFTWLAILAKINLHIIYPISSSLTLVTIILGSVFFLGEKLQFFQIIGVAVIVMGIFILLHK